MPNQNSAAQFSLHREQILLMMAVSNERDSTLIALMGLNGLRREEAVNCTLFDIEFSRKRLLVHGKNKKKRIVPFDDFTYKVLYDFQKKYFSKPRLRNDGSLFASRNSATGVLNLNNVNRIIAKAGERAGLTNPDPNRKYINPHILRHSYAHHLKMKDVPLEVIRDLMGHASILTTADQYGRRSIEEIEKILKTT